MNKDFQKILILGMISIIISTITLYSFRDIKFKNTKKLNQQIEEKQDTLEEYQELLNDPNEIQIPEKNKNLNTTGELNIVLPKFLFNSGFQKIAENLEKKEIKINFNYIQNLSQYKSLISSGLNKYDIYLIPTNWTKGLDLETISIGDNPKPYFHIIFNNLITTNNNKIIPYSIDPIITVTKEKIDIGNKRENIFSYSTLRSQHKSYAMPIIRGIGKNDIRLLERLNQPFENYFDILYQHITQIGLNNNIKELRNMLDTEKISLDYKYNFATFKQLYEIIQKRDENCKTFPAICIMSYGFGDIKFGFLSDFDVLDKYFSKNTNSFEIQNFINSKESYPVRGRIFIVPKNNQNINLANEFFVEYIKQSIENNTGLRNNTLSAINNIYNIQKNQDKYKNIIKNEDNFKLIYENINLQEEFIKDSRNLDVLKGNYNPELYLRN